MRRSLTQTWMSLDELHCALSSLQNELNDDDLEMTLGLIEQKPLIDGVSEDYLIQ